MWELLFEPGYHAALWLCVSNNSSMVRSTPRSFANNSSSICLDRGTPRRSHISIALRDTLSRAASIFLPPSRSTMEDISRIAAIDGLRMSQMDENFAFPRLSL